MNATLRDKEISDEDYQEVLNDAYGTIEICGQTFDSGYALRELDPTAFRCGKADHEDTIDDVWECSECSEEYKWEDDAEECCKPEPVEEVA